MMKVIMLDPFEKKAHIFDMSLVTGSSGLQAFYAVIKCDRVEIIELPNGDHIVIDEEGLLKNDLSDEFSISGVSLPKEWYPAPLAGRVVICGDLDGRSVSEETIKQFYEFAKGNKINWVVINPADPSWKPAP